MALLDSLLAIGIVIGLFFLAYTAYRKQGLLETVQEIKGIFEDKVEDTKDSLIYQ